MSILNEIDSNVTRPHCGTGSLAGNAGMPEWFQGKFNPVGSNIFIDTDTIRYYIINYTFSPLKKPSPGCRWKQGSRSGAWQLNPEAPGENKSWTFPNVDGEKKTSRLTLKWGTCRNTATKISTVYEFAERAKKASNKTIPFDCVPNVLFAPTEKHVPKVQTNDVHRQKRNRSFQGGTK